MPTKSADSNGEKKLIPIQTVSHLIDVGETKLRAMIRNGEFMRPVMHGGKMRWLLSEVELYLEALTLGINIRGSRRTGKKKKPPVKGKSDLAAGSE